MMCQFHQHACYFLKVNSFFSPLPFVPKQHQGVAAYCDIESVIILLKRFPKEKKDVVDFLGFGSLLKYNILTLRSNMCLWMLNNFDPESKTFNITEKSSILNQSMSKTSWGLKLRVQLLWKRKISLSKQNIHWILLILMWKICVQSLWNLMPVWLISKEL